MKAALKTHPRYRLYRCLRKAVRRELEPKIFDRYVSRGISLEQALDDYLYENANDIARDLVMLSRAAAQAES